MAEDSIKDFTVNWMIGGLLMFCLLSFAISFVYNNNSTALDDGTGDIFSKSYDNISSNLYESSENSNSLLNVTSNTNPEISDLGSMDSVSVGFEAKGNAAANFEQSKLLLSWVFSGDTGKIILEVLGGFIGLLAVFYIWRFIKNGS